jgi:RHS repeat-associated protein
MAFSLALFGQQARITNFDLGGPGSQGWQVEPARGELSLTIPIGTVPGEIPIPVTYTMNGTYSAYGNNASGSTQYNSYGVYGTVNFGYIWPDTVEAAFGSPGNNIVLEDGRSFAVSDFASYAGTAYSSYGSALLSTYGVTCAPASVKISADGQLLWATIPTAQFTASFQSQVTGKLPVGYPAGSNIHLLIDKNRIRVYAEVFSSSTLTALPVYWADKFGHCVTFQWTRCLVTQTSGPCEIFRVDALNQRGQGVTLRWAWFGDTNPVYDLLRADFVGVSGPCALLRGYYDYSVSAPVGFNNPLCSYGGITMAYGFGGAFDRPTSIILGDPNTVPQPSWSNSGSSAAAAPALPATNTGTASQTWSLTYDSNHAAISSITTPSGVQTNFTYTTYTLYGAATDTLPTLIWGVTEAQSSDTSGQSPAMHTTTWSRTLPVASASAWSQKNWTVTSYDWWNGGGASGDDRTTTRTFYSPCYNPPNSMGGNLLDYQNGTLEAVQVVDGSGNQATASYATYTNCTTNKGGGLDGSLSIPYFATTTRPGENGQTVTRSYTDSTFLQLNSTTTTLAASGTTIQTQAFSYNNLWRMLEGNQITQVATTRYNPSTGVALSPGALTTVNVWDGSNLLQLQKSYLNGSTGYQHGTAYLYDSHGRVSQQGVYHVENGASPAAPWPQTVIIGYDDGTASNTGQPSSWTTQYEGYSATGVAGTSSVAKVVNGFDAGGRPSAITDEKQVQTTYQYDLFGRPTAIATQGLAAQSITYPDPWTIQKSQGPLTTTLHLDGFGRRISQDMANGTHLAFAYDLHGRPASTSRISTTGVTITQSTQYDVVDRPVTQTGFDGVVTKWVYQPLSAGCNQVKRTFSTSTNPTVTQTDPFGQVTQVTAATGDLTQDSYDGWGHLTQVQVTDQASQGLQTRTFTYNDPLGRLTQKFEPETGTQTFSSFDPLNHATYVVDGGGNRTRNLTFDGLGRLCSQTATWGANTDVLSVAYSGAFLGSKSHTATGAFPYQVVEQYAYYPSAQGAFLASETTTQANQTSTVTYAYNNLGSLQSLGYPSGRMVNYQFDSLGRVNGITSTQNGSTQTIIPAGSPFDVWGNRASIAFQSGASDQWALDATQSRIGSWIVTPKAGNPPMGWSYGYDGTTGWLTATGEWNLAPLDSLGRMTTASQAWVLAQNNAGQTYQDASGQISESLQFDGFGNNTSNSASPTPLPPAVNTFALASPRPGNQLPVTAANGGTLNATYDACGQLTQVASAVSSGQYLTPSWDPCGRLQAVTQSLTGDTARYQYAPSGLRVATMDGLSALQNRYYAYSSAGQLLTEWNLPNSAGSTSQVVAAKAQTASSAVTAVKIAAASPTPQSLPKPEPPDPGNQPPPKISSFTVNKSLIPYGGSAVLNWSVINFSTLTVNGVRVPSTSTSLTVSPSASTTTYTLVAASGWGTATATVTVQMQPGITSFYASPATIVAGASTTLNWTAACASSVTLNGVAVSGSSSLTISPGLGTNTYTLTAATPGIGSVSASVTITVDPDPTVPTITFTANPSTMLTGQSTTLSWSVSNSVGALAVTLNGSPVAASGTQTVALTASTGFQLAATSTELTTTASNSASVQVTVDPYPTAPSISFTASPSTIYPGASTTLSWNATSAVGGVTATLNGVAVPAVGSQVVSPSATTSYQLAAVSTELGATASNASNLTVTVTNLPTILSFSASPTTVPYGGSTTLSWVVSGATTTTVNNATQTGTSMQVTPTGASTTYTLTISNSVGSASASVVVTSSAWIGDVIYLDQRAVAEITNYGVFELHSDHLGTPRIITSGSSGAVVGSQTYAPYGELIQQSGYVPLTGFTGHLQTEPNGLIYMRGRYYSPAWHCFLNSDQGADPNSLNQYAYCGGNPMVRTDPTGMFSWGGWNSFWSHVGHTVSWDHHTRGILETIGVMACAWEIGAEAGSNFFWNVYDGASTPAYLVQGAVTGGVAGGAMGGSLKAAGEGALGGAMFAGAGAIAAYSNFDTMETYGTKVACSGMYSRLTGGSFKAGIGREAILGGASALFTSMVGWAASPESGQNMNTGQGGNNIYDETSLKCPDGMNVFGTNTSTGFFCQSGWFSCLMNAIPGMNAVAQYHDDIVMMLYQANNPNIPGYGLWGTMPPCAAVAYGANLDNLGFGVKF